MTFQATRRTWRAVLTLGLALAPASTVLGQVTGPGISTGSGAGTGTGASAGAGVGTTGSGISAGMGVGTTGSGVSAGVNPDVILRGRVPGIPGPVRRLPDFEDPLRPRDVLPPRPGPIYHDQVLDGGSTAATRSPTDPSLLPLDILRDLSEPGPSLLPEEVDQYFSDALERSRGITEPSDRALALERLARAAILGGRLDDAHQALRDAGQAALEETTTTLRDLRLMGTITTLINLTEAQVREGILDDSFRFTFQPQSPRTVTDRMIWLERANDDWAFAIDLARQLASRDFRSEMLYRVVESQAGGSEEVASETWLSSTSRSDLRGHEDRLNAWADATLVQSANNAWFIERPVWRDQALMSVANHAAKSSQFARGLEIARSIPQPEIRSEALVRLAESQARRGYSDDATDSYHEAVRVVAAIRNADPREVLAGVLIDSLIAVGRFQDARASVGLYRDRSKQLEALGAVAESQGRRGLADDARAWINRDVPDRYRPMLLRKVNDGALALIEQSRGYLPGTIDYGDFYPSPLTPSGPSSAP